MSFDIHLYITDHEDTLPDLHTMQHSDEVRSWFSQVDGVCMHHEHFSRIDDSILKEAKNHEIKSAFAVLFYPPGEVLSADDEVGEKLKKLFKSHGIKFSWNLTLNDRLQKNFYDVYLELIVKPEKKPPSKPQDSIGIEEREKRLLGELHPEAEKRPEMPGRRSLEEKVAERLSQ